MIFTHRPRAPFWRFEPPEEVICNQLGYTCAPNHADAHYAGAGRIEDFIAYGFRTSWLSPDDFTLWWRLENHDIGWLREYFLRVLEDTLQAWYEHGHEWEFPTEDFGDIGLQETLNVGDSDDGEDEEVMLGWRPVLLNDEVLCLVFRCDVVASASGVYDPGDYEVWLDRAAMEDRARVRCAIAWARKRNVCPHVTGEEKGTHDAWERLRLPYIEPPDVETCGEFTRWWDRRSDGKSE
jgi:hypothetical protein